MPILREFFTVEQWLDQKISHKDEEALRDQLRHCLQIAVDAVSDYIIPPTYGGQFPDAVSSEILKKRLKRGKPQLDLHKFQFASQCQFITYEGDNNSCRLSASAVEDNEACSSSNSGG